MRVTRGLAVFQKRYSRAQRRNSPEFREAKKVYDQYLGPGYDSVASQIRRQYEDFWRNYGGDDIDQALESGALTFGSTGLFRDEVTSDLGTAHLTALLTKLLQNPRSHLLLDDHIRLLAKELTENGGTSSSDIALINSARAGVGSRFIEHLPVFPMLRWRIFLKSGPNLQTFVAGTLGECGTFRTRLHHLHLKQTSCQRWMPTGATKFTPLWRRWPRQPLRLRLLLPGKSQVKPWFGFLDVPKIQEGVGALTMGLARTAMADLAAGGLSALAYKYGLNVHEILKARQAKRAQDAGSEWQYLLQLTKRLRQEREELGAPGWRA